MQISKADLPKTQRVAYSYVRFSSKPQEQGASLSRQVDLSANYVKKHNLKLDDSLHLHDLGVSAFEGKNARTGALSGFLQAVASGRVERGSLLLVENLDRLSRAELSESVALFLQIINAGIDIVSLVDDRVFSKPALDMTSLIISIAVLSRGHEESSTKRFRVRDAYLRKVAKARAQGGKFRITRMGPGWLRGDARDADDGGSWEIIPDRAKLVREIFRMYDEGFGKWRICGILNDRGVAPFGGAKKWSSRYIASLLTNPAVVGTFRPGHADGGRHRYEEGKDIRNYFPPVVSDDLFQRCYAKIKGRYQPPAPAGRIHLLSGLTWCGHLNEPAVVWGTSKSELRVSGTKRRYRYYYFVGRSIPVQRSQKYRSWNVEYLEKNFVLFCLKVDWARIASQGMELPTVDWQKQREMLNTRVLGLKKELAHLYNNLAAGLDGLQEQIRGREKELKAVELNLGNLDSKQASEAEARKALALGLADGKKVLEQVLDDGGDLDTRTRLKEEIRKRVERVVIYAQGHDVGGIVERSTGVPLKDGHDCRCYKVIFKSGVVRWVIPEGKKDTEVRAIFEDYADSTEEALSDMKELPDKYEPRQVVREKRKKKQR